MGNIIDFTTEWFMRQPKTKKFKEDHSRLLATNVQNALYATEENTEALYLALIASLAVREKGIDEAKIYGAALSELVSHLIKCRTFKS